jgi:VanZ family protein
VTEKLAAIVVRLAGRRVAGIDLVTLMHPFVRKAAHMGEYAVLFLLLFLSFAAMMRATRAMSVSIFVSFLYACADEYHQTMIAGRSGQWTDVCVDMTGVLAAVMVLLFIYAGWQGYDERKKERKRRT